MAPALLFITSVLVLQAAPLAKKTLSLQEATQVALQNQPQLRLARAQTDAAMARADEARAPLLPQVGATAIYQRSTNNIVPRLTQPGSNVPVQPQSWETSGFWNFGVTASQLVYDFGQTRGRWRAAQASSEGQQFNERSIRLQALLNVRTAYFQARAQKASINVTRDTLDNQQKHLAQIQGFVEVGTRPAIDLAQTRADVANAKVQLIGAENAYAIAKAQLNEAMGSSDSTDYDVAEDSLPPVTDEDQGIETLVQSAAATRPELVTWAKQIEAQEQLVRSAKGNYGPSLGVSTGLTEAGRELDQLRWNWYAQATINWPLFQGLIVPAQVREAEANLVAAKSQRDLTMLQLRFEVEQARLAVRAAKASLDAIEEVLTNARQRLRLAEGRYQTGAGSIIELADAQIAMSGAAGQRVSADYNLATARAQLLKALGRD